MDRRTIYKIVFPNTFHYPLVRSIEVTHNKDLTTKVVIYSKIKIIKMHDGLPCTYLRTHTRGSYGSTREFLNNFLSGSRGLQTDFLHNHYGNMLDNDIKK
ncbi:hypothetical protein AHAS_Ahas01G0132700 [Arachis hypogaea]